MGQCVGCGLAWKNLQAELCGSCLRLESGISALKGQPLFCILCDSIVWDLFNCPRYFNIWAPTCACSCRCLLPRMSWCPWCSAAQATPTICPSYDVWASICSTQRHANRRCEDIYFSPVSSQKFFAPWTKSDWPWLRPMGQAMGQGRLLIRYVIGHSSLRLGLNIFNVCPIEVLDDSLETLNNRWSKEHKLDLIRYVPVSYSFMELFWESYCTLETKLNFVGRVTRFSSQIPPTTLLDRFTWNTSPATWLLSTLNLRPRVSEVLDLRTSSLWLSSFTSTNRE